MNDLLKLAIEGHGGGQRWKQMIMVPTRRRVYVRNPDGSPVLDSVSVAVDVTDVAFS